VSIALTAIGQSLDAASPRDFSGKSNSPVTQLLSQAEIGLSVTRGTMSASGQPGVLTVTTPLNGKLRITGQIGHAAGLAVGGLGSSLGGLLGGSDLGTQIGGIAGKAASGNLLSSEFALHFLDEAGPRSMSIVAVLPLSSRLRAQKSTSE
jgi:Domain of unknown function (DUF4403)